MSGPLSGLRVIDVGTRISAPFCAGLLGEWGAEVIKVEEPGNGDFMRSIGPFTGDGYSLFWATEGRGRSSATCDLRHPDGQALFRELANTSDVVCENFRPGTMERWGIGPGDLGNHLVWARISAFGQDGPYAGRPGLDRTGIAMGGLMYLTGEPDRPPLRPGVTVADYLTGVFAAEAVLAALYRRDRSGTGTGIGAVIDASLYGSILRILEWTIAAYDQLGIIRQREGNRLSNSAPLDNYATCDGSYICIVAGSDANFARLCRAMERTDLLEDPRYETLAQRASHGDELNEIVAAWAKKYSADEVERRCLAEGVPAAKVLSVADIFCDPHMRERGDLVRIEDPVIGTIRQQAPYPRLVNEPTPDVTGAPVLGSDNERVWCDIVGLRRSRLDELRASGII